MSLQFVMKREIKFSLVYRDMWQSSGKYVPTVSQLKEVSHRYGASLNDYLVSVFVWSVYTELLHRMPGGKPIRRRPQRRRQQRCRLRIGAILRLPFHMPVPPHCGKDYEGLVPAMPKKSDAAENSSAASDFSGVNCVQLWQLQ